MKWFKVAVIIMTMLCVVCAEDYGDEEGLQDNTREMKQIDREGWRAVESIPEGNFGWNSPEFPEDEIPKRRRLRKRKRRPSVPLGDFNFEDDSVDHTPSSWRRIRPQHPEPWEEMADESVRRPNVRRRVTPYYQSTEKIIFNDELRSNPLSDIIHFEEEPSSEELEETPVATKLNKSKEAVEEIIPTDLKTILKHTGGGLSLSEILQEKNLSLTELLMGNRKAISALTERTNDATELGTDVNTRIADTKISETTKYKRLPPSVGLRKNMNRNYDQAGESLENISTNEMLEAQRRRLALLHGNKDSNSFSSVTTYDVVTEPTTERRIFVPSHPKYYTSIVYKPDFNPHNDQQTESLLLSSTNEEPAVTTTTTTSTTTTPKSITTTKNLPLKPKLKGLPVTSAKITKSTTTHPTVKWEENEEESHSMNFQFPEPKEINVKDVYGFKDGKKKFGNRERSDTQSKCRDEPMRVSIDLEEFIEESTKIPELENYPQGKITQTIPTITEEPLGEKINNVTAKEELMEVLKDPVSKEKLTRILENINMTIEELVQQRERGSSQLHLADIFHNKTREPEPKEEPFVGHVISEHFSTFSSHNRQQKSRTMEDERVPSEYTSEVSTTQVVTESKPYAVSTFRTIDDEMNESLMKLNQPIIWNISPELSSQDHETYSDTMSEDEWGDTMKFLPMGDYSEKDVQSLADISDADVHKLEDNSEEDLQMLDIDNTLYLASNEQTSNEELIEDESSMRKEVVVNIHSGVKSAIMVSLVIVGLSIIVFLTILIVFRWTQRQKRKLNYCNSLSLKLKSPVIMQKRPTDAIKSFVNETLGRKNYYKSNIHNLSDDMWQTGRDRKPSF